MVFGFITNKFRKKKNITETPSPLTYQPTPIPSSTDLVSASSAENTKAKMDLLLTQIESMRIQNEAINERLTQIERMLKEIYDMAKAS